MIEETRQDARLKLAQLRGFSPIADSSSSAAAKQEATAKKDERSAANLQQSFSPNIRTNSPLPEKDSKEVSQVSISDSSIQSTPSSRAARAVTSKALQFPSNNRAQRLAALAIDSALAA